MFCRRIRKLLIYLLFSRHGKGHGIHSPFVFKVITTVFRNKIDPHIVLTIERIRKKNLKDHRTIEVLDLGSGSSVMKTNSRKVSEIARYTTIPAKYGALLHNMAAEFGGPYVVELGTSLGISTMYLASGCPDAIVYSVEGSPATADIAYENFNSSGFRNIHLVKGPFDTYLPELISGIEKPGLVFIDGNHGEEPLMRYFKAISQNSTGETVIIIDDIHLNDEMERAWYNIRNDESVTLSIDIFRMGIVFFRKGINHIDYTIRY